MISESSRDGRSGPKLADWRASELLSRDLAAQAAAWTADFYIPRDSVFKVAYQQGESVPARESPNATTSSVVLVWKDIEALRLTPADLGGTERLRSGVAACLSHLPKWDTGVLLPLRSFGPLPLFSTSYLAQALTYCSGCLSLESLAIAIRRIIFELARSQDEQWGRLQTSDQLHPFVLFHCARALVLLRDQLRQAEGAGDTSSLLTFSTNVANDSLANTVLAAAGYAPDASQRVCGAGLPDFRAKYLLPFGVVPSTGPIDSVLLFIEGLAFTQVIAELARNGPRKGRGLDSSVLAFGLQILLELNGVRHGALLSQGSLAIAEACEHGSFPPGRPFNIDNQGRALAVPSVQIANSLLSIGLSPTRVAGEPVRDAILEATRATEAALAEGQLQIEVAGASSVRLQRQGWCSDRAPSMHRVDAWITAHAALFFLQRLRLLAAAKRHHVLSQYSWITHSSCKPAWSEIEDPNAGLAPSLKDTLTRDLALPSTGKRPRAPVFLLYGPPGTSKTTFVQGLASLMSWDLVTLSPSDFISDSMDRIELRAREIFGDLTNLDECVVLLDEMDSLLRDRAILAEKSPGTIMEFVVPALLPKLQQLRDYTLDKRMAVFFVSNYYETIDQAILRSGRIDFHVLVPPYSRAARERVLRSLVARHLPSVGVAELDTLVRLVSSLPCNLVYRDLDNLVQAIANVKTPDLPTIFGAVAPSLGISPEIYNPAKRPKAYPEFCSMVARLQDRALEGGENPLTRDAARTFLQDAMGQLDKHSDWRAITDAWVDALR